MEFKEYKLSQLLEIKNGKDHQTLSDGQFPVYGSGGIIRYADSYLYDKPSILLPRKGSLTNIQYCDVPFWTVDTTYYTVVDFSLANPYYLYRYLSLLDLSRLDSGTGVPSMTFDSYYNIRVQLPDLAVQQRVAAILQSLDEKIKLNDQINQNLEALAKQLYDYWFVQFDFPDENGRPYKSSGGAMVWNDGLNKYIPNYWNVLKLSDLLREDRVKQINPQDNPNKVFRHLSFPSLDACGSFYEEKGENIKSNKIVVKDEYVLAAKLNPWIKRIAWGTTDEDLICSTEFVVLNPYDKNLKAFLFLLVNQKPFIDYCTSSSTGTSHSQRRVKPDIMKLYKFPYNEKVAQEFSKQVLPIIEITKKNNEQNRELAMQRDKLLPLLMNGQVSLNSDLSHD